MYYFEPPLKAVIEQWNKAGGETWQLIEPVDGFHPNQLANALFAEYQWSVLVSKFPQLVGDVNPNNAQILARFGDQGT
jgi:acyloxyacyl hydrolase